MGTLNDDTHLWQAIGAMMDRTICHHQPMTHKFGGAQPASSHTTKCPDRQKNLLIFCFFSYKFHQAPEKLYKPICKLRIYLASKKIAMLENLISQFSFFPYSQYKTELIIATWTLVMCLCYTLPGPAIALWHLEKTPGPDDLWCRICGDRQWMKVWLSNQRQTLERLAWCRKCA